MGRRSGETADFLQIPEHQMLRVRKRTTFDAQPDARALMGRRPGETADFLQIPEDKISCVG
jgi:hypothetical protein